MKGIIITLLQINIYLFIEMLNLDHQHHQWVQRFLLGHHQLRLLAFHLHLAFHQELLLQLSKLSSLLGYTFLQVLFIWLRLLQHQLLSCFLTIIDLLMKFLQLPSYLHQKIYPWVFHHLEYFSFRNNSFQMNFLLQPSSWFFHHQPCAFQLHSPSFQYLL